MVEGSGSAAGTIESSCVFSTRSRYDTCDSCLAPMLGGEEEEA
jgi:hypothetical protein